MSFVTLTVKITNGAGAVSAPASATVDVIDAPVIDSLVVSPQSAVAGTTRTLTINAHDTNTPPLALTYEVTGAAVTPVAGVPNQFTFVA